ncbi:outer membrane beta-barrel protein [Altererythrobacter sp. BO-6]|uniref:outer membrane beta-barrel protein n=1 Tax=Altererythrobacter sp. BO-6 TaxID=2604537 RepID=UPI0013E1B660|nr:outer membrane beta-barrel protein [Altererythrobacter sp. BO-6]QIG53041.1 outer membrane beta-barrel protein [Altererythrobacter sp. BO-6]
MRTPLIAASSAFAAALVIPTAASAQDGGTAEPFVGLSAGYHDLGVDDDTFDVDDSGAIFGVVAGVDFPVTEKLFVGAEANYHFGTDAIDNEYGIAARLGIRTSENSKIYLRGGYQEVDLDLEAILDAELPEGLPDSEGDYIVGVGGEFGLGGRNAAVRVGVDTISFDSLRATAGVVFNF